MNEGESRIELDHATLALGRRSLASVHGRFEVHFFRDQAHDRTAMAIVCGDLGGSAPVLARVHSSCVTSECLLALDCDCAEQLDSALATIARTGRGVVFYLMQEGRGAGLTAKARDRMIVQASGHRVTTFDAYAEMGLPADLRTYEVVGPMARALGIRAPLDLLTNNPHKARAVRVALANEKIEVRETVSLQTPTSDFNRDYLRAKRRSGHDLARDAAQSAALPPSPVVVEPPLRAVDRPHLISTAYYFLPVDLSVDPRVGRGGGRNPTARSVDWFRMRVVYDSRTARESVLLSQGLREGGHRNAVVLSLVDRLPCFDAEQCEVLRRSLIEIREGGEGGVVVEFDESNPGVDRGPEEPLENVPSVAEEILAAHWISARTSQSVADAER
jgi:GTP cyclohydrolase II